MIKNNSKNINYEVERISGERRREVTSVFEFVINYLFSFQFVSEPILRNKAKADDRSQITIFITCKDYV